MNIRKANEQFQVKATSINNCIAKSTKLNKFGATKLVKKRANTVACPDLALEKFTGIESFQSYKSYFLSEQMKHFMNSSIALQNFTKGALRFTNVPRKQMCFLKLPHAGIKDYVLSSLKTYASAFWIEVYFGNRISSRTSWKQAWNVP